MKLEILTKSNKSFWTEWMFPFGHFILHLKSETNDFIKCMSLSNEKAFVRKSEIEAVKIMEDKNND